MAKRRIKRKRSVEPFGKKVKYVTICLRPLFRGRYVVTALNNRTPRGGWNIIPRGTEGKRGIEVQRGETERKRRTPDEAFLWVPLFHQGSYLPFFPTTPLPSPHIVYFRGGGPDLTASWSTDQPRDVQPRLRMPSRAYLLDAICKYSKFSSSLNQGWFVLVS